MSYNQKPSGPGGSGMGGGPPNGPNSSQQVAKTLAGIQQQMQNLVHGQTPQADLNAFLQQQRFQNMVKQQQIFQQHFQQQMQQQQQQQHQHQQQGKDRVGSAGGGSGSGGGGGSVGGEPLALTRTPADLINKTFQQHHQQQPNGSSTTAPTGVATNPTLNPFQQQLQAISPNLMQQIQAFQYQMQQHQQQQQQQQQQQHHVPPQGSTHLAPHQQQAQPQAPSLPLPHPAQQQHQHQQQQKVLQQITQTFQQRYLSAAAAVSAQTAATAAAAQATSSSKLSATPPPPPPPLTNQLKPPNLPPSTQITPVPASSNCSGSGTSTSSTVATSTAPKSANALGTTAAKQVPLPSISLLPAKSSTVTGAGAGAGTATPTSIPTPTAAHQQSKNNSSKSSASSAVSAIPAPFSTHFQKSTAASTATPTSVKSSTAADSAAVGGATVATTPKTIPQINPVPLTKQSQSQSQSQPPAHAPPTTVAPVEANNEGNNSTVAATTPNTNVSAGTITSAATPVASKSAKPDACGGDGGHGSVTKNVAEGASITPLSPTKTSDNVSPTPTSTAKIPPAKAEAKEVIAPQKTQETKVEPNAKPIPATKEHAANNTTSSPAKESNINLNAVAETKEKTACVVNEKCEKAKLVEKIESKTELPSKSQDSVQKQEPGTVNEKSKSNTASALEKQSVVIEDPIKTTDKQNHQSEKKVEGPTTQQTKEITAREECKREEMKSAGKISTEPITKTKMENTGNTSPAEANNKNNVVARTSNPNPHPHPPSITKPLEETKKVTTIGEKEQKPLLEQYSSEKASAAEKTAKEEKPSKIIKADKVDRADKEDAKTTAISTGDTLKHVSASGSATDKIQTSENMPNSTPTIVTKKPGRQPKSGRINASSSNPTTTKGAETETEKEKEKTSVKSEKTRNNSGSVSGSGGGSGVNRLPREEKRKSKLLDYNSSVKMAAAVTAKQEDGSACQGSSSASDRKSQRHRLKTILYQSPLPELAYITKLSASEASNSPKPMSVEDKLIVFYKNEYMAVRNAEGTFYLCQTMQNVYRTSPRISIRWLSEDAKDSSIYIPDFYDHTDIECVLTTVDLKRVDKGHMRLPATEKARIESILRKAIDVEKGIVPRPELTEENPDGLDISLYKDESQIEKKSSSHTTPSSGSRKSRRSGNVPTTTPKSTNAVSPTTSAATSSGKRRRGPHSKSAASSANKSSNKKRKILTKRKKKAKRSSTSDEGEESSYGSESDIEYKPNQKKATSNSVASKSSPRAQRSPLAKARAASPITPTTSRVKNVPQKTTSSSRNERATKRKAATDTVNEAITPAKRTPQGSGPLSAAVTPNATTTPSSTATTTAAATTTTTNTSKVTTLKSKAQESASDTAATGAVITKKSASDAAAASSLAAANSNVTEVPANSTSTSSAAATATNGSNATSGGNINRPTRSRK